MPCPLGDTGWQIAVEGYYNADGRLYGELDYGEGVYGDQPGSGLPTWNDVTARNTAVDIIRGDQEGGIEPPVAQMALEFFDPELALFDWAFPRTGFDPEVGAPIRVRVIDPGGTSYTLTTQILDRVTETHAPGVRVVQAEAFDVLSQYAQPLFGWSAPAQTLSERLAQITAAVQPAWDYGRTVQQPTIALVADPLATDPEEDEQNGIDLMRIASASAGQDLDSTVDGVLRVRTWPLPWTYPVDELTVTDCDDSATPGALPVVVTHQIGYVMDLDAMVNRAIVEHRDDPLLNAQDEFVASVAVYSPRKEALGWPITGAVHADQFIAQTLAERTVARFGGLIKRPLYVDANVVRDPRWLPVLAALDTGQCVRVRRTAYPPILDHRCVVVGVEHTLNAGSVAAPWEARIYLSSIEQTIGASPPEIGTGWNYGRWGQDEWGGLTAPAVWDSAHWDDGSVWT